MTIEGVRVVIDSGLARVPRFEPDVGLTRLETVRVSRAAADQRRGRAGRTEPGVCYRLWDERQTRSLAPFAEPEILLRRSRRPAARLRGLGRRDPRSLTWLDPPPAGAIDEAREHADAAGGARRGRPHDAHGRRLRSLPLPPRLARMVLGRGRARPRAGRRRDRRGASSSAGSAATMPTSPTGWTRFRRDRARRAGDMRKLAAGWARMASAGRPAREPREAMSTARLLALAYPERIGKARGAAGQFLLANGRGAYLDATHHLARAPFLVAAELSGAAASTRILLAAAADEADVAAAAGNRIRETDETELDAGAAALRSRRVRRLDAIVLAATPRAVAPSEETARLLAEGIARLGVSRLPWSKAQLQLRDRTSFLRAAGGRPKAANGRS